MHSMSASKRKEQTAKLTSKARTKKAKRHTAQERKKKKKTKIGWKSASARNTTQMINSRKKKMRSQ